MGILSKIFSSGATELVEGVGGVLDDLHTSKEEKLAAELKIKELISNYELEMERNVTERWKADMEHGNWMTKNIRPYTLAYLTIIATIFTLIDFGFTEIEMKDSWISFWQTLAMTAFAAFFGGRTYEKIKGVEK